MSWSSSASHRRFPSWPTTDSGTDPQGDSTGESDIYDIRFSKRAVVQLQQRRNLRIVTRLYEPDFGPGSWVNVDSMLDPRGGRRADAVLHIWILDMTGNGCELQTRSGQRIRRGTLRFVARPGKDERGYLGVSCHMPVYRLNATKRIRWRVTTIYGNGEPVFDVAPREGMYS